MFGFVASAKLLRGFSKTVSHATVPTESHKSLHRHLVRSAVEMGLVDVNNSNNNGGESHPPKSNDVKWFSPVAKGQLDKFLF